MNKIIASKELLEDSILDFVGMLTNPPPPLSESELRKVRISEIEYEIGRLQYELDELKAADGK